ncbi:glycine cleavage system protein H [Pseudomonas jinjuensis]|uniref:Glycine cleavage system H protein n=1 Tax=Pseudomonas jinjuensis TaxID=198616 RepID=A0A1H0G9W5_9PSED|nr:glycine cleavage system protein H [Pseudomonas jinjuensis]SDO03705.1 glycine cleavage system H protein [Pseudomonas jinjuensis]
MKLGRLEFPEELLYAPAYNLWLRREGDGSLTLGLTSYGCALYGQIFAFTPKRDGWHIDKDRGFGVVEFAKAASSARSPLAGTVLVSNDAVVRRPGLINQDCYGEGWMIRLKPDDWPAARGELLQGQAALDAFAERMRLDAFDPDDDGVQALRT